ncbi:GNAT family N-acetyltransferase [Sphingomonas sp. RT2P30]|uniref:GNAT family N-acetyltransferase n=1 Tax=Parasphingomonas halimpatiens TaxID=3096162 RepID=UPI002FC7EC1B
MVLPRRGTDEKATDMKLDEISRPDAATGTTELTTRSGYVCHVRPVRVGDEAALATFFAGVSSDDLRFRFLSGMSKVPEARIAEMTHVDHGKTEDFVVFEADGETIVANALLAADEKLDTAEVAISIRHDVRGRGIGWALLDHVARQAKAKGIRKLCSIESHENHAAIELEREMGFTARTYEGDPSLVLLEATLRD